MGRFWIFLHARAAAGAKMSLFRPLSERVHCRLTPVLAVAIACFVRVNAAWAPPSQIQTFSHLDTVVSTLLGETPGQAAEWDQAVRAVRDRLADLEDRLTGQTIGDRYLMTLGSDATLLDQAAAQPGTGASIAMLRLVVGDLTAKVGTSDASLGLSTATGGDLTVNVRTERDGHPVDHLLIRANMAGDPNADPPFVAFNQPTNSAEAVLPPGIYLVLVRISDDTPAIRRQYITVSGRKDTTIQVTVPLQ
jgi:hypothetical protein